jgi:hypothetical protein
VGLSSSNVCRPKPVALKSYASFVLSLDKYLQTRGDIVVQVMMKCSIDFSAHTSFTAVIDGTAFYTSMSTQHIDWRNNNNNDHISKTGTNEQGNSIGPCVDEWIKYSMTFDPTIPIPGEK